MIYPINITATDKICQFNLVIKLHLLTLSYIKLNLTCIKQIIYNIIHKGKLRYSQSMTF